MDHLLPKSPQSNRVKKGKAFHNIGQQRLNTVKYLSGCSNPTVYRAVLKSSPDSVVKTICDAALNVQRGAGVTLSKSEKTLFGKHRKSINTLISKTVPIAKKRKVLSQRGGAFWIPALISAALSGLGPALFGALRPQ